MNTLIIFVSFVACVAYALIVRFSTPRASLLGFADTKDAERVLLARYTLCRAF